MKGQPEKCDRGSLLIGFLETHAEEMTQSWLRIVRNDKRTRSYQAYDQDEVHQRTLQEYQQLARWIAGDIHEADIATHYSAVGARRRQAGFSLAEVLRALIILRRVLWFKLQSEGILGVQMDAELALECSNKVILYFDRAIYHTTVGFERTPADMTFA